MKQNETPENAMGMNVETDNLEELTSQGEGSGLEVERADEGSGDISAPFDPKSIDVVTQQRTVDLLMARLREGELNLSPDFQRRANLWNDTKKSALIESMLLRIPIPSLYVSEDDQGNYEVVDGLQRLCAIAHFVKVSDLNKALNIKLDSLRLKGLQSLGDQKNNTFEELPRPLQRRIQETELTLHVIRAGTPPNVKFNIFSRINQGGLPLNSQEIRNAVFRGKWRDIVRRIASSAEFLNATEGKIKGERLEDHELVLRAIALYSLPLNEKRRDEENLDEFLNNFVEKRSVGWSDDKWAAVEADFYKAITAARRIFGLMAFRKYSPPHSTRRPINRGLFEAEVATLARRSNMDIQILTDRSNQVIERFRLQFIKNPPDKPVINDPPDKPGPFSISLLYATGKGWASNKRTEVIDRIFDEVLNAWAYPYR